MAKITVEIIEGVLDGLLAIGLGILLGETSKSKKKKYRRRRR